MQRSLGKGNIIRDIIMEKNEWGRGGGEWVE